MAAARILILTSGPLGRNPRPLKEALTLARNGYAVTVVTGFESQKLVAEDEALVADSGIDLQPLLPPPGVRGFARRLRTALARRAVYRFGWQLPSSLGPAPALLHVARSISSDLVIAHNETALWAATRLHRSGRRVAADLEDWYSEDLLPSARIGHIGLYRNPGTLEAVEYYFKMPQDMHERDVVVVDPMLATGHSAIAAITRIKVLKPKSIKFVCLLTCPEGVKALREAHPDVAIYTAAIDRQLNSHGYKIGRAHV